MIFRSRLFFAALVLPLLFLWSCSSGEDSSIDEKQAIVRADSLSVALNSPELKKVNDELREEPSSAGLYDKRARVYLGLRYFDEAANDSKRAIRLDSLVPAYYLTLVDVYYAQNNTRLAKELLEKTTVKFPSNTDALLKLAELYFLVKKYQEGIDYVNKALKVDENIAKGYYIKGSIYRESGDTSRAISSLETAVEQDSRYKEAFYDLGVLYAARKNPLAIEYYNNALRIDPMDMNARYARAKFLQDMNRIDDAVKEYESMITDFPGCENCFYNLGAIFLELRKDPAKAVEYFTKAIEVNKSFGAAYFARGYSYSLLNDKKSARADYNMCLQLEPNNPAAIEGLNAL